MRTPLRLATASVAAASLVAAAAASAAAAPAEPGPAQATPVAASTGSSMVDSGAAALESAGYYLGRGDFLGLLVLVGVTPFQMLTGAVCDLGTGSGLPVPCTRPKY
ncbi:hypothetical protein IU418_04985 [Nocardia farcinica]|uniref:hypothetical protein n=1 Tax=Nocardia farcinica TaxID=37329 RepID=UPI001B3C8FA5|nr:hypothetical protein [Nocardia farcinica]MBF6536558.1 hypothetical protein [Nocardia farcinica]